MDSPPPASAPSNYPRPDLAVDRQRLREIASAQRQVMLCVLGQIGIGILNGVGGSAKIPALSILAFVLLLVLLVFTILSVLRLAKAMGFSQVLYVILMFVPCVSLIVLLMLSGKATKELQQAGIKVGLLGADPKSI